MNSLSLKNPRLYSDDYCSELALAENFLNDYSMRSMFSVELLSSHGRHWHAILAIKYGLEKDPYEFRLHVLLLVSYYNLHLKDDAERQLQLMQQMKPFPRIREIVNGFLSNCKYIPDTVGEIPFGRESDSHMITQSLLGIDGGFGNQFFQYLFGKIYSEKYGLEFQTYEWIGQTLFNICDTKISKLLPFFLEIEYYRSGLLNYSPAELGIGGRDLQGYFQLHSSEYIEYKSDILSLFKPITQVQNSVQPLLTELRSRGHTLVVVHIRLGDAESQGRASKVGLYLDWLEHHWKLLDKPILFLASDQLNLIHTDFAQYFPATSVNVSMPFPGADFYPDFFIMTQADFLLAGNSTFSFAASMLNEKLVEALRPNAKNSYLESYDPWNAFSTI